ncbi:hypothetical protein [Chitinimonas sp. JJ19]|uniref:hypothetical protein n=1 Tax=Chitinimonas sp. JJ19 TaxID=3109352 RepID=UPI003002F8B9
MQHKLIKTSLGVGLLAAGLTAQAADYPSFGQGQVYYKPLTTGGIYFASLMPNGDETTSSVLLLEMLQGTGTAPNTWTYIVSSSTLAASSGRSIALTIGAAGANEPAASAYSKFTNGRNTAGVFLTTGATSLPVAALPFSYSSVSGSGSTAVTCDVTFNANVDIADQMTYAVTANRPKNWAFTTTGAVGLTAASANTDAVGFVTAIARASGANSTSGTVTLSLVPIAGGMFQQTATNVTATYPTISNTVGTLFYFNGSAVGAGSTNNATVLSGTATAAFGTNGLPSAVNAASQLAGSVAFGATSAVALNSCINVKVAREKYNAGVLGSVGAGMLKLW